MTKISRELLARLPKAELHVHLDGSVRPATLLELGRRYGKPMPAADAESLAEFMHVRDVRDLVGYLERFEITLSVMQTDEALERIAFELAEDLAKENVRWAEIRFSPVLNAREELSLPETLEATRRGLARAEEKFGIGTGMIVCGIRNMDPKTSAELADLAVSFRDRGVVAFDLAGAEEGYPPLLHQEAFQIAADGNLPITIHAGEAFGAASIHQAIHQCHANRIGHGTRLYEDPELLRYVRDLQIPLEICLTSNVQTRAAATFEEHPLRSYYEEGLSLSLNTDNRLMSATTMTDEYWRAHRHLGLPWKALVQIARSSFAGAFLPWNEKQRLVHDFDEAIGTLTEG